MTGTDGFVIASLSGQLTSWIGHHGAYAVFVIMALDALLPVGGELTMLFAGALAAGAITGEHPVLLGHPLQTGLESYLVLSIAGTLGYLARLARRVGDRPLGRAAAARAPRALAAPGAREPRTRRALVRPPRPRGRLPRAPHAGRALLHLDPRRRAGEPAGAVHLLTLAGSAIWCFGFAAAGWALGSSYAQVHHAFRYVDILAVAGAVAALAAVLVLRRRRRARA